MGVPFAGKSFTSSCGHFRFRQIGSRTWQLQKRLGHGHGNFKNNWVTDMATSKTLGHGHGNFKNIGSRTWQLQKHWVTDMATSKKLGSRTWQLNCFCWCKDLSRTKAAYSNRGGIPE